MSSIEAYTSKATGYFPTTSANTEAEQKMEGGGLDRHDKPLHTLQDFLAGEAPYVSCAMDLSPELPYGTVLLPLELWKKYGKIIELRVVDTGAAFTGKGTSRVDVCCADKRSSEDAAVNGTLTLVVIKRP